MRRLEPAGKPGSEPAFPQALGVSATLPLSRAGTLAQCTRAGPGQRFPVTCCPGPLRPHPSWNPGSWESDIFQSIPPMLVWHTLNFFFCP